MNLFKLQYLMLEYALACIIIVYAFYRYYYRPKAQINRYKTILGSLGYKVYQQPFQFLGPSFVKDFERGKKLHNDAMYFERVVYSQVDVVIGCVIDKIYLVLVNPDLIKEFYSTDYKIYPKFGMAIEGIKAIAGKGIVFSEGEQWKNKRKIISKVFSFDLVKENIPKISEICERCFDVFDSSSQIGQSKFKFDVLNVSARIFNGVMMKCFFGTDQIKEQIMNLKYEEFVVKTMSQAGQLARTPLLLFLGKHAINFGITRDIRHIKECIRLMKVKAGEILKKRMEEVKGEAKGQKVTDIIQALIRQKLANKEEFQYSDEDLVDEFQTFLIAGTDTTSRLFTMMVYYLGKYPDIQERLREQINWAIKNQEDINYQNLKRLTYIDWIQLETTRFYGPANGIFARIASKDHYIQDIPIRKGTLVSTQPRGNHFNPKYFRDPQVFRPERWESECDNIHPYAFIGFSAGPRSCIGKQLAYLQSKIALTKLIRRYKSIEVPEKITMNVTFLYEAEPFDTIFTK